MRVQRLSSRSDGPVSLDFFSFSSLVSGLDSESKSEMASQAESTAR